MPVDSIPFWIANNFLNAPVQTLSNVILSWLRQEKPVGLVHPHGFFVFPLLHNDVEEWRFHVWPKGPRVVKGMPANIHTHDLDIDSRIIQGELTNILYDITPTDSGGHPLYQVSYKGDKYSPRASNILQKTNKKVQVNPTSREIVKCGGIYHIKKHVYHEAFVSEDIITATLVRMHSRAAGDIKVVGLNGYPETISFQRTTIRALDVTSLFPQ
jgi:hypothetical protein